MILKKASEISRPLKSIAEEHLKVRAYLGDGIYLHDDDAIGSLKKINPVYDEPHPEEKVNRFFLEYQRLIAGVLSGLPMGSGNIVVQYICSQRGANPFTHPEGSVYADILKNEGRFLEDKGLIKRDHYLSILWYPKKTLWQSFKESLSSMKGPESYQESLLEMKRQFERELKRITRLTTLNITPVEAPEYLRYCASVLGGGYVPDSISTEVNDLHKLSEHVPVSKISPSGNKININGKDTRIFIFGHFPIAFCNGRLKTFLSRIPVKKWEMIWSMSEGSYETDLAFAMRLSYFSKGPRTRGIREDMESFRDNITTQNPYGKLSLKLIVHDCDEDAAIDIIRESTMYLNAPCRQEEEFAVTKILHSLPLNSTPDQSSILGDYLNMPLSRAVGFLPLYGGPPIEGFRLWRSNRNFPTSFNLFKGDQNRIFVILGVSGAGKSSFLSPIILEFKAQFPDGIIRIIDNKTSYMKTADFIGGKSIILSPDYLEKKPFSPFALSKWGKDEIELITSFISSSIVIDSPKASIQGYHEDIIKEALTRALSEFEKDKINAEDEGYATASHITWEQISEQLEPAADAKNISDPQILHQLRMWTLPFNKTGKYGFIFCAQEQGELSDSSHFVVYDLGPVEEKLLEILSRLVSLKVCRDLSRLDESIPKLVIIEELGVFLQGGNENTQMAANQFVQEIVKTVRKYGGVPGGVTNQVEDFFKHPGGKAFWSQAQQRIFLPMAGEISNLKKLASDYLDEGDFDCISSLKLKDKEYSQAYVINNPCDYKGIVNLSLTPFMYCLSSTSPSVVSEYKKLRRFNEPYEALNTLTDKFIGGEF